VVLTIFAKFSSFWHNNDSFTLTMKKKQMKSGSWFLIIMHPLDKVRTYRVEGRVFIILGCLGLLLVAGFAFFIHQYFSLRQERRQMIAEVRKLGDQVAAADQKLKQALPENISHRPASLAMAIDELKVVRATKGKGFAVSFRLVNQTSGGGSISGTLAMVAKNEDLRVPLYRVIPEIPLDKGIPLQPAKGREFEVKGQKFVEAFFDGSSGVDFKTITVYVYSPDGKMILQKSANIPEK